MTHRDRSWMGWKFHGTPAGTRIKGYLLKIENSTCICTLFKIELKLHRYLNDYFTGMFMGQVVEGLTILWYTSGLRNKKGLITQKDINSTYVRTVFKIQSWKGPSIKYVTLRGGNGSEKVWQFVTGGGGVKIMWSHTFNFFTIHNFMFYFIFFTHNTNLSCNYHLRSCKKLN